MSSTVMSPLSLGPSPLAAPELNKIPGTRRLTRALGYATVILSCLSVLLVFSFYGYVTWWLTHPAVDIVGSNPMLVKNLKYQDITFMSANGHRKTDGWWIPSAEASSPRTVVLSHGFGANREESWVPMYDIADLLHKLNYNVLMFDYGYANAKNRTAATGGREESQQLIGALQYAHDQGSSELIVWGFSMGAGTALQAALQTGLINGMILDSTFITSADTIAHNLKRYSFLPTQLSTDLIRLFLPVWSGTQLDQIPAEKAESTAFNFPILLIHGTADEKAPYAISERVAKAQHNPDSELWIVPSALHEMIFRMHPEEYVAKTTNFLSQVEKWTASQNNEGLPAVAA